LSGRGEGGAPEAGVDPLEALGGTALRVYLYLLARRRPVGVRELQRALGFRSPSTARHHLERLASLGLVEKLPSGYRARRPRGLLGELVSVAGVVLPRSLFVAGLALGAAAAYTALPHPDPRALTALWATAAATLWHALKAYLSVRRLLGSPE